jgi:kumamolisin
MSITLTLTPQNAAGLKALVGRPHAALTPAQFNAQYAPAAARVTAIRSWATASKLTVASVSANRLLVTLTGSSTDVAAALHTSFARFSSARDGSFYAPTSGTSMGFAGPVLYSTEPSTAFHDIVLGANVLYTAGPGYDLTTGLGTPDIAKLVSGA